VLVFVSALLVVIAAFFAASSAASRPITGKCGRATAEKLIRALPVGPAAAQYLPLDQVICVDFTGDGHPDLVVAVWVAMNHGAHYWAAFRNGRQSWVRVAYSGDCCSMSPNSFGMGISIGRRASNRFVVSQPVYRPTDPACCPSGGMKAARWAWRSGKLRIVT
jgi:hypothetical protein